MALCQGATSDEVPAVQSLYFLVRFNGKYTALCIYKQFGTCSGNGQTGFTYSSEPTGHGLSFVIACVQDMCIVIWGSCQEDPCSERGRCLVWTHSLLHVFQCGKMSVVFGGASGAQKR